MNYFIDGKINSTILKDLNNLYKCGGKIDYLYINSPGGDFISSHNVYDLIHYNQPDLPVILKGIAFSAAAYLYLCMDNRYIVKGSSLYIHDIQINIFSKDSNLLLHKRKKYSTILKERIQKEFYIDLDTTERWLKTGVAFTDEQLINKLNCKPIEYLT